jgi:hypothetical protein
MVPHSALLLKPLSPLESLFQILDWNIDAECMLNTASTTNDNRLRGRFVAEYKTENFMTWYASTSTKLTV